MKKEIRMYLVFWSNDQKLNEYKSNPGFATAKTGDMYLIIADTVVASNDYVDFKIVEKEFLNKCQNEKKLIENLNKLDGFYNIEVVPTFTKHFIPGIYFDKEFFEFLSTIQEKFSTLDIDMYVH